MEVIYIFKKANFNVGFEIFWLKHFEWCLVCDHVKIFFTSKFNYVFFCNLTNKTEIGTTNRWGTTNNKPLGPIIMMGQLETLSNIYIIFITFFSIGA